VRDLIRPAGFAPGNLILPLFAHAGSGISQEISSMPEQFQLSCDLISEQAAKAHELGVGGVILFGIPKEKDAVGSDSCCDEGIVQQAAVAIKKAVPGLLVITDVCFCEYTDHGHCGVIVERNGKRDVDNDATLELLGRQAVSHARAGADMIAPSGMMDGMVQSIRGELDANGFHQIPIMSYAAKFASAFYGPFRDAAQSSPQYGDRRTYQMDPSSCVGQALREVELDVAEGADLVMVKPALAYLDVISAVAEQFQGVPVAAYSVSGEYSMVEAAAAQGWIDRRSVILEILHSMQRAGAQTILTYWAAEVAQWIESG